MAVINFAAYQPYEKWVVLGPEYINDPEAMAAVGTPDESGREVNITVESNTATADARLIAESTALYAMLCLILTAIRFKQLIPNPDLDAFDDRAFRSFVGGMEQVQRRVRGFQEN